MFDDDTDSVWICGIRALRPSMIVVGPDSLSAPAEISLRRVADGVPVVVKCRVDQRATALPEQTVAECGPMPTGEFTVDPIANGAAGRFALGCFPGRSLTAYPTEVPSTVTIDRSGDFAWWTCIDAEFVTFVSDEPAGPTVVDELPATGGAHSERLAIASLLLLTIGVWLLVAARRPRCPST